MLRKIIAGIGYRLVALANWLGQNENNIDLSGDRDIEWSWVLGNLPEGKLEVLDFGCGPNPICSYVAERRGARVTAFDIGDIKLTAKCDHIYPVQGDILDYDFGGQKYDVIINCSTIEHIGLKGRYRGLENKDADLRAMSILRSILKLDGKMILTVPVGKDAVYEPWHRVYGQKRLPILLSGWEIQKSEFWAKNNQNIWYRVSMDDALNVEGSPYYYALGLFVLTTKIG